MKHRTYLQIIKYFIELLIIFIILYRFQICVRCVFQFILILSLLEFMFAIRSILNVNKTPRFGEIDSCYLVFSKPTINIKSSGALTLTSIIVYFVELTSYKCLCFVAGCFNIKKNFLLKKNRIRVYEENLFKRTLRYVILFFQSFSTVTYFILRALLRFIVLLLVGLPYKILQFFIYSIKNSDVLIHKGNIVTHFILDIDKGITNKTIVYTENGFQF